MTVESLQIKQIFRCDECGKERGHGSTHMIERTPTKWRLLKVLVLEFPNREAHYEFHVCDTCWPEWKARLDG